VNICWEQVSGTPDHQVVENEKRAPNMRTLVETGEVTVTAPGAEELAPMEAGELFGKVPIAQAVKADEPCGTLDRVGQPAAGSAVGGTSPAVMAGESTEAATGAVMLGPVRTGTLGRTYFDQFVINSGGEDVASEELPMVEADGPSGTLDRPELGQLKAENVVEVPRRLVSVKSNGWTGATLDKRHVEPPILSNLSGGRVSVNGTVNRAMLTITEHHSLGEMDDTSLADWPTLFSNDGCNWRRRLRVAQNQFWRR
jgi:hypothetical protein